MDHLLPDKMAAYVAGRLDEEETFYLETHIASCEKCASCIRAHRFIGEYTTVLLDNWSAKEASRRAFQNRLSDAMMRSALPVAILDRLRSWAADIQTRTKAALRITLEGAQKRASIVGDQLAAAIPAPGMLVFQPTAVPVRVRGRGEQQSAAVESIDGPYPRITADPALSRLTIQIDVADPPWPLAVLLSEDTDELRTAEFRRVEGEDFLIASFEDLDDGDYAFLLENMNPGAAPRT